MKSHLLSCAVALALILACIGVARGQGVLILQAPDWNQPSAMGAPAGYGNWCSPTAGSNLMGYWEDVMGCTGLTDRLVMPQTVNGGVYPATAGTWEQGLWLDGSIEMGWWMDTGGWRTAAGPFPPNVANTDLLTIGPGLVSYASTGWTDNDYNLGGGAGAGSGIVKVAYPNVSVGKHTTDNRDPAHLAGLAVSWPAYMTEIDAGRPVEVTFTNWVNVGLPILPWDIVTFPGQTIEEYAWLTGGDPHSVVGVGYYDATPGTYDNDGSEYFICQDGWGTTGQYVRVPVDAHWMQNDYVYFVPEPATLVLLAVGFGGMLVVRTRRK